MDDETNRIGIKNDLTTLDDYLNNKFTKLSPSGHDLTPLSFEEIENIKQQNSNIVSSFNNASSQYLGMNQKGIYVCIIGGLPLFTSGYLVKNLCNHQSLFFTQPCDDTHISTDNQSKSIRCVRSNQIVGRICNMGENNSTNISINSHNCDDDNDKLLMSLYQIDSTMVRFFSIDEKWPVESQPENYWGTEGQYRAWNSHERIERPLSY